MADDMNLQIVLQGVNEAGSAFTEANSALEQVKALVNELTSAFSSFNDTLKSTFAAITSSMDAAKQPLEDTAQQAEAAAQAVGDISKSAQDAGKQAASELEALTKPLQDDAREAGNVSTAISEIAKTADSVGKEAADSLKAVDTQLKDDMKQAQDTAKALESVGKASSGNHSGGSKPAGGGQSHEKGGIFSMQGQMDSMYAGTAVGAPAAALDVGLKSAIDTYGQFDQAVANVNSMMGLNADGVAKLKQQLLDLSPAVNTGPADLANALYGIVGAGVPAAQAMDVLKTSAEAAKAGQTDVATASGAIISVMDSYGVSADKAGQIADQMFAANAAGAMTFDSFARSIGNVAGPAAQVGVSFDQVAGATAALTNQGLSAQRATQGLRALMVGIAAPTSEATKEAKKLGIEWDNNALQQKGLVGMMQEAMQATGGNAQELKKLIPNIAAWTVATDLGGKGADSYKQAMDQMAQASGATGRALQAQEQGYTEQLNATKAAIQEAEIAFAQGLIPALQKVGQAISDVARWFTSLSPKTQEFISVAAAITAVVLTLGSAFFLGVSAIGAFKMGMEALTTATKAQTAANEALAVAEEVAEAASPVGWIIAIVAAVILVAAAIYTYWDQIKAFLEKTWTAISATAVKVWNSISDTAIKVWNSISEFFKKWGLDIVGIITLPFGGLALIIANHWDEIKSKTSEIWNSVSSWLSGEWNKLTQFAATAWTKLQTDAADLWNGMVNGIKAAWNGFTSWISSAAHAAVQWVVDAFDWMYNHNYYFQMLVDYIKQKWQKIKDDVRTWWNNIRTDISTWFNNIYTDTTKLFDQVRTAISDAWTNVRTDVATWWNNIRTDVSTWFNNIVTDATTFFDKVRTAISTAWTNIRTDVAKWWNDIRTDISTWFTNIVNDVDTVLGPIFNKIGDIWTKVKNKVSDWIGDVRTAIKTEWDKIVNEAEDWGKNLIHMFAQGISNAIGEVTSAVKNVASTVSRFLGFHSPTEEGPGADADTWMPNMMNMFISGIQSHIPQLQSVLNQALGNPFQGASAIVGHSITQSMITSGAGNTGNSSGNVYITVQGSVIRESELVNMVSRGQLNKMKMQGKFTY